VLGSIPSGPTKYPFKRNFEGDFCLISSPRRRDAKNKLNSLAAYFPWGGAKNKLLGGLASIITFEICILAKAQRRKEYT